MGQMRASKLSESSDLALLLLYPQHLEKHVTHSKTHICYSCLLLILVQKLCLKQQFSLLRGIHTKRRDFGFTAIHLPFYRKAPQDRHWTAEPYRDQTKGTNWKGPRRKAMRGGLCSAPVRYWHAGIRPSFASSSNLKKPGILICE